MARFSFKWLTALAAFSLLSIAALAQTAAPAAQATLGVTPTTVNGGSTVTVFGSITNTSSKAEKVSVDYEVTGPCNYYDSYSVKFTLKAGETRTASNSYTAPACAGDYTVTATATSGGTVLDIKSATFTVQ